MGLDQMEHPAAAKGLDFAALLARIDKWDYSVSANSHSTRMWERAYPARYTSLDYGYPRNDVYYTATAADVRAARERLGIAPRQDRRPLRPHPPRLRGRLHPRASISPPSPTASARTRCCSSAPTTSTAARPPR